MGQFIPPCSLLSAESRQRARVGIGLRITANIRKKLDDYSCIDVTHHGAFSRVYFTSFRSLEEKKKKGYREVREDEKYRGGREFFFYRV